MVLGVDVISFTLIDYATFIKEVVAIFESQDLLIEVSTVFVGFFGLNKIIALAFREV